jgi:hypothetical protein
MLPECCRGVESGIIIRQKNCIVLVVVLLTRRSQVGLPGISGSLFTVSNRFDTTIVEAEGVPLYCVSIRHRSDEVKRIYLMTIMHNSHTRRRGRHEVKSYQAQGPAMTGSLCLTPYISQRILLIYGSARCVDRG